MRIIFAGTPEFAAVILQRLLTSADEIIAVYTQPDRPAGRGRQLQESPVKQLAQQHHIPIYQPLSLRNAEEQNTLKQLNADIIVVVAYGMILPQAVLDIPRLGCINVHPSLLPRWRGAAPIQRAILAGDKMTGVTIMQMEAGLDSGPMLKVKTCPILSSETSADLHTRLASLGAEALIETLIEIATGTAQAILQDNTQVTYAHKIEKTAGELNWACTAKELACKVQAFNPWPVAYTYFQQQPLRIWQAQALDNLTSAIPGTLVEISASGLDIATGNGLLRLQQVQLPGKKIIAIGDFINAYKALLINGKLLSAY